MSFGEAEGISLSVAKDAVSGNLDDVIETAKNACAPRLGRKESLMPDPTTTLSESALLALGIYLEEYDYPYPVQFFSVSSDFQQLRMAYMDIAPKTEANGKAVVLFHGKAFGCYYFHDVIEALTEAGYRVVAPDQLGWGKSPKPDIHHSFQLLAATRPGCSITSA